MSGVSHDEIRLLATLARLRLEDHEVEAMSAELSAVLENMASLAAVDTTGVEPMTHVVSSRRALRADVAQESLPAELVLSQAPQHDSESFLVPAILPKDSE